MKNNQTLPSALLVGKRTVHTEQCAFFMNKVELCSLLRLPRAALVFLLAALLGDSSLTAQTTEATLTGVIIDAQGEDPLPGATVYIEELKRGSAAQLKKQ